MLTLFIGNANYSSWSLRGWLALRESGLQFAEEMVLLDTDDSARRLASISPAARVPVLMDGDECIWDSLAIMETLIDRYPDKAVSWPKERAARARARAVVAEMHSGFSALRDELPMNIRARVRAPVSAFSDSCQADLGRMSDVWREARTQYGQNGPWLFGEFSVADIVFAPVVTRFVTFAIPIPDAAATWVDALLARPAMVEWCARADAEPQKIEQADALTEKFPAADA